MTEIDSPMKSEQENVGKRYPKKIITSFQLGNLVGLMMSQMYSQQMPYYYQSFIGLNITLYLIAQIIFMVFNMFNDPLLGYLSDRSTRFTKRWGKRFPFIVMGAIPYSFMVIFLFSSPSIGTAGHVGVFVWYLVFQFLMDTFFSLYDINRVALFPDKFRNNKDRKIGGTITTILETLGILLGLAIPIIIIGEFGEGVGYPLQAVIVAGLSFVFFLLMIPGVREDSDMKQRRALLDKETEPFFKGFISTLKNKNYIGYISLYIGYTTAMGIIMATIPFFVEDILLLPKIGEFILAFYIIAVIISAPIWYKLSSKFGIKKVALIGAAFLGLMGIPFIFLPVGPSGLPVVIVILFIAGFADGAIITMTMPIFSSVIDEATIKSKRRKEGVYQGTFIFISRVGIAINAFVFWIVRTLTGYQSGSTDPFELLGLRLQMSIFPMIIIFVGIVIFWRAYKITEKQMKENSLLLNELNL
ncbi:MAG: MFS transporter [Promethearchaeota archaeon]|jgi:GPH family glycoside/pentoside/hexuronide:cation symporter